MKYCSHCGKELMDEAIICPGCGCAVEGIRNKTYTRNNNDGLLTAAKVFMIISCVACVLYSFIFIAIYSEYGYGASGIAYWLPLVWAIPMTVSLSNAIAEKRPISVAFKVCTLLFVSLISGILLLCVNDAQQ